MQVDAGNLGGRAARGLGKSAAIPNLSVGGGIHLLFSCQAQWPGNLEIGF